MLKGELMSSFCNLKLISIGVTAMIGLSGCSIDPQSYETTPVKLNTAKGVVTCQLYTKERVLWDRAIDRPESMSVREADNICRAEGERQKRS